MEAKDVFGLIQSEIDAIEKIESICEQEALDLLRLDLEATREEVAMLTNIVNAILEIHPEYAGVLEATL